MDLIGPFQKTLEGHEYVLTVTDYFSKFVEAVPIADKSAISVARGIFRVYCRQGAPLHCICDQGKEFVNKVYKVFYYMLFVKHVVHFCHCSAHEDIDRYSFTK